MKYVKSIHESNLGSVKLKPLQLLNRLQELKLYRSFPNACIAIKVFCTIPVTINYEPRKNDCTDSLLAIESDLAKTINFDDITNNLASKKARRT
ncbi:hypothetical protein PR048_017044, partial [Dryococelus australis]